MWVLSVHFSGIRGLSLTKLSSETRQNLPYFSHNENSSIFFFFILIELKNEKKNLIDNWVLIVQIYVKRFARQFHQASYF